jgi:hypothetical protein
MREPHAPRYLAYLALILCILVIGYGLLLSAFRGSLFTFYAQRLNTWVADGGDVKAVQSQVVEICRKLVMSQAGLVEQVTLIIYSDELDYRVGVCTKMTVNRVHKQPAFSEPDLVNMICDDPFPYHALFQRLCRISGLRSP